MKFKPDKTSYKDVVVATDKNKTIKAIRYSDGDYGVFIKEEVYSYLNDNTATFSGKKSDVIKALELVIEELKEM